MLDLFLIIPLGIVVSLLCGFIGSFAGADETNLMWRRIGIPLILTIVAVLWGVLAIGLKALWFLSLMFLYPALTLGYGIPGVDDSGSDVGRFWFDATEDRYFSNILTRATMGLVQSNAFLSIPLITGHWNLYAIFVPLIILVNVLWGAIIDNEGTFNFRGKELLKEEFYIYFGLGFNAYTLIALSLTL